MWKGYANYHSNASNTSWIRKIKWGIRAGGSVKKEKAGENNEQKKKCKWYPATLYILWYL